VSVDIQPEYQSHFTFKLGNYINFLTEIYPTVHDIVFFYNGADTLGMISEDDYKYWLVENGLSEDIVDSIKFYDKGYAFFRYCMDEGIDDEAVANFVRYMYQHDINDSRNMTREHWANYLRVYRKTDKRQLYDLLKSSDDLVNIPDLMEYIKQYNNLVLVGGGVNECLKEVEIALKALNKPYDIYKTFTY
jgi:predicted DNA-binding protein (MmcQ/YjbR family)